MAYDLGMGRSFVDQLMEAKRRATLAGRPITPEESGGIVQGWAENASARLARAKALEIQQQEADQMKKRTQMAKEAQQTQQNTAMISSGVGGALAGGILGGSLTTAGAATGATAGGAAGGAALGAGAGAAAGGAGAAAGAGTGATTGATVGTAVGPGYGTLIGAGVGAIVGLGAGYAANKCVIITACTSADSREVGIARMYRDSHMSPRQLFGYYILCAVVVPLLRFGGLRWLTKRLLVDRLVDFGEVELDLKNDYRMTTSPIVAALFLGMCTALGAVGNCILKKVVAHA